MDPGIHTLAAKDYHADPCPEPSLSGSIAVHLVHRSPAHAWWAHPRLNPAPETDDSKRLDFGSVSHRLLLGAGAEIDVIEADSYRTKAAQEARDASREAGRLPILRSDYTEALAMADAASKFLNDALPDWRRGRPEQTLIWREGNAWCRGMVDFLSDDRLFVLDYKTTAASARPADAERTLFDQHYHLKAAFYERGLDVLHSAGIGRRRFLFLFQEVEAPYACSLLRLGDGAMTIGRKQMTYAIRGWQHCIHSGEWPGYGAGVHVAIPPPWIESRWLARELYDPFATGELAPGGRVISETEKQFEGWTP